MPKSISRKSSPELIIREGHHPIGAIQERDTSSPRTQKVITGFWAARATTTERFGRNNPSAWRKA